MEFINKRVKVLSFFFLFTYFVPLGLQSKTPEIPQLQL